MRREKDPTAVLVAVSTPPASPSFVHSFAGGVNLPPELTVALILPRGSLVATYTSSSKSSLPGTRARMKCKFSAVSVTCRTSFARSTTAAPI